MEEGVCEPVVQKQLGRALILEGYLSHAVDVILALQVTVSERHITVQGLELWNAHTKVLLHLLLLLS